MTDGQVISEIIYTANIIYEIIGKVPLYFRPPYGELSPRVRQIINALNLKIALWDHDTLDWAGGNAETAARGWANSLRANGIVLQHDAQEATAKQIPAVLDIMVKANITAKRISECLGFGKQMYFDKEDSVIFDAIKKNKI